MPKGHHRYPNSTAQLDKIGANPHNAKKTGLSDVISNCYQKSLDISKLRHVNYNAGLTRGQCIAVHFE